MQLVVVAVAVVGEVVGQFVDQMDCTDPPLAGQVLLQQLLLVFVRSL